MRSLLARGSWWHLFAATVVIGMLISSALVWQASKAAFSGVTSNPANTWLAGSVGISDDDSGTAAFPALAAVKPGDSGTRCITVTYNGTIGAAVALYGATSGALASELAWSVQEGQGGTFGSCAGFVPAALAYSGTMSAFAATHTDFGTGVGLYAPAGQGETRTYKLSWQLPVTATGAGNTADLTLTWTSSGLDHQPGYGFGANSTGQLGVADDGIHTTPTAIGSITTWITMSAGAYHACAIKADRTLWCWGWNLNYELGQGVAGPAPYLSPTQVGTDTDWAQVAAADGRSCAIKTTGTLWCWGFNGNGELGMGVGDLNTRTVPTQVGLAADWRQVQSGSRHTCATKTTGTLWCWGYNGYGELGGNVGAHSQAPVQVGVGTTWAQISPGVYFTCATKSDNTLWCWGKNTNGALGAPDGTDKSTPTQVGTETTWSTVAAGDHHTCAVKTTGTLWCWGRGGQGQLGQGAGDLNNKLTPTQVGGDTTWASAALGGRHSCAISRARALWCWGYSDAGGTVGTGATSNQATMAQVRSDVRFVDGGTDFTVLMSWPV